MSPRSTLAASAALSLLLPAARAQPSPVWGLNGAWEAVAATGVGPQGSRWHSAATTAGSLFVTGGTGAAGNATFQLDCATFAWTQLPPLPQAYLAPALIAFGGLLLQVGGETGFGASDEMLLLSTTNSNGGWLAGAIPGATFGPRNGHRVVAFGGNLYGMGGWNGLMYFNDVFGLDLNSFILNSTTASGAVAAWTPIVPNGAAGMWPARSAFSLDVYSASLVIFGGIYANGPVNPSVRVLYNDAWYWVPSNVAQLAPLAAPGWTQFSATGVLPPCRYGHVAGVYGDQLFVFGGTTWDGCGAGPGGPAQLNDLWALNLPAQVWGQVAASNPWPSPRGVPAGVFVGRHLYIMGGDGVSADTWRWAPSFLPSPSGGGGGGSAVSGALGATATVAAGGAAAAALFSFVAMSAALLVLRRTMPAGARGPTAAEMGTVYAQI